MIRVIPPWVTLAIIGLLLAVIVAQEARHATLKAAFANYQAIISENSRKLEVAYRAKEQTMRDNADRIAREQAQKEAELQSRADLAESAADSLRHDIERLNAAPAPKDPALAALARQAGTARKLLGTCAEEYRSMADGAERLRLQVNGLQSFVTDVCH